MSIIRPGNSFKIKLILSFGKNCFLDLKPFSSYEIKYVVLVQKICADGQFLINFCPIERVVERNSNDIIHDDVMIQSIGFTTTFTSPTRTWFFLANDNIAPHRLSPVTFAHPAELLGHKCTRILRYLSPDGAYDP